MMNIEDHDIVVQLNFGTNDATLGLIQQIESAIDAALKPIAFTRVHSDKEKHVIRLGYFKYAKAGVVDAPEYQG